MVLHGTFKEFSSIRVHSLPLKVSSGHASSLLSKRALLSCRLPEPKQPDEDDVAEYDIAEGETAAFRAHLLELKEWTHYPEEGSPGSVGLLDGIHTYADQADTTDPRCGSPAAMGVDPLGAWVWIIQGPVFRSVKAQGVDSSGLDLDWLGPSGF